MLRSSAAHRVRPRHRSVVRPVAFAGAFAGTLLACKPNPVDTSANMLPGGDEGAEEETTGAITMGVPATYRFSCMDVQQLGSADGNSLQAGIMEDQWGADIKLFRLNLLVDYLTLDMASGTGELQIRSGIGANKSDQCTEPNSDSEVFPVTFEPSVSAYGPNTADGACSQPDAAAGAFGTFELELTGDDVLYIYAEDNQGEPFNCTSDPTPDAVPIRAVRATFTMSEDEQTSWGNLTACMLESEAQRICACLGTCTNPDPPDPMCGCNEAAAPLSSLLLGVTTTDECTTLMGAPAFDVQIGFAAERLPNIPDRCG